MPLRFREGRSKGGLLPGDSLAGFCCKGNSLQGSVTRYDKILTSCEVSLQKKFATFYN